MIYAFTFTINEDSEAMADPIYAAGADDANCFTHCGVNQVAFERESDALESAIRSALNQLLSAGCTVLKLEVDVEHLRNTAVVG